MLDRTKCLEFAIILQQKVQVNLREISPGVSGGTILFPEDLESEEVRIFSCKLSKEQREEITETILEDGMEFKEPCYVFYLAHAVYHALTGEETKH